MRKFEIVSEKEFLKNNSLEDYTKIKVPSRATSSSAGYDFYLPYDLVIKPKESILVKTGIKACMENDEFLMIVIRSSLGVKKGLQLSNNVGIIDSDYYNNIDNEGHIMISLKNCSDIAVTLMRGERIAQGIFLKYLKVDDDSNQNARLGGFGSTN